MTRTRHDPSDALGDVRPGDPADRAIARLVEAEGGRLYALGRRFCGNDADAADLVQETFLEAYRGWDGFRGEARPSTWLYRIAARVCGRMHRKRSAAREEPLPDPDLAAMRDGPVPAVASERGTLLEDQVNRERIEAVETAIATLPPDYRVPLVLKEIIGFSVADVADVLGLSEGAAKTRLHRARLQLAVSLAGSLPARDVPPPKYDEQVCLDLLRAKQEALDRGVEFPLSDERFCERCAAVFATLDLTGDICRRLGRGELPETLRRRILEHVA